MSIYKLLLCGLIVILPETFGVTEWGFSRYVKYEPGNTSLILTAPHGGNLDPSRQSTGERWPDRTDYGCKGSDGECIWTYNCGQTSTDCKTQQLGDLYTVKITGDIADRIKEITGFRPHVVYNLLNRTKLDTNREINDATGNISDAIKAYQDYNGFICKARSAISGRGLLLDIHGSGDHEQRMELGYLIHSKHLDSDNYSKEVTSIRSLGRHWCGENNNCFKTFICGNRSLGHFMNLEGFQAVPSPQNKKVKPDVVKYFSGGFTVTKYGSKDGGDIDGIQIEFSKKLRSKWGESTGNRIVNAILSFYRLNYL